MKIFNCLCLFVNFSIGMTDAQTLSITGDSSSFTLSWESVPDRSYFLQVSADLNNWVYCDQIFYGDGSIQGTNCSVGPSQNQFFRLAFTDSPAVNGDPGATDFDLDGLNSLAEVDTHFTDPFLRDTDRDWLGDGDEVSWALSDPLNPDSDNDGFVDDGNEDFDNDNWKNYFELALVSPPHIVGTGPYAPTHLTVGPPGDQRPAIKFRCHPGVGHGYHYRVQSSYDLSNWEDVNHYENGVGPALPSGTIGNADTVPVNDGTGAHEFTVKAPQNAGPFLRVEVSEPFPGYDLRTEEVTLNNLKTHSDAHFDRLIPQNDFSIQIFDYYKNGENCRWAKWCWTNQIDFTGVSWDEDFSWPASYTGPPYSSCELTMISPRHFLCVTHFVGHRGVGAVAQSQWQTGYPIRSCDMEVVFYNREGQQITRRFIAHGGVGWDLTVGLLDEPLPDGIKFYKVLPVVDPEGDDINWNDHLSNARTLNTVRTRRCVLYRYSTSNSCNLTYSHRNDVPAAYQVPGLAFNAGTSSNPNFIFVNGEPILLGLSAYRFGTGGYGPFVSAPPLFRKINTMMSDLGGGFLLSEVQLK